MLVPTPHADALARIPVREREVTVLGSRTRFWDYGPEDAHEVLVLAHGYRGDHHGLEAVITELDGIRVISPDLPGFGDSTPMTDAPHSIAGYAQWLSGFIATLNLATPPVMLGHSFGSIMSSHAIADGLAVRGLVLVNPITTNPRIAGGRVINALTRAFYAVSRAMPQGLARLWLGNWLIVQFMSMSLVNTPDATLRRWIHQEHHRYFNGFSNARTVADAFRASISTDVLTVATQVPVPTLLIAGEFDTIAPVSGQHEAMKLFPDARLVVLEGTGHLAHYETPGMLADAIRTFLARLPAVTG